MLAETEGMGNKKVTLAHPVAAFARTRGDPSSGAPCALSWDDDPHSGECGYNSSP